MKPYYEHGGITIYHGDCREILPALPRVDIVITDPPYGTCTNTDSRRFSGGQKSNIKPGDGRRWPRVVGDNRPFDPTPLIDYPRVVLWGANHFGGGLPSGTWLVWIKKPDHLFGTWLSDCELAWMKGGRGVYAFRKYFTPPTRIAETGSCLHPTQKPEALMAWAINRAGGNGTICDPYMGSGTTLVAAQKLQRRAIGIEIEERYCEVAAERLSQGVLPL